MGQTTSQLYHPLDSKNKEVRLLRILPEAYSGIPDKSSPVLCELFTTGLAGPTWPTYRALSYVWGDENEVTPILVNGIVIQVTTNLASALRHIRDKTTEVVLWADAVCINQKDLEERKEQ